MKTWDMTDVRKTLIRKHFVIHSKEEESMKSVFVIGVLGILLFAGTAYPEERSELNSHKERLSYSFGYFFGMNLKRDAIDIDLDILMKGIRDSLSGNKTLITEQEMKETLTAFQKEMQSKHAERMKAAGEKNKKEGEAFLAENKKKEGVVTLPSGLQYRVMKEGTGKKPDANDVVVVHYKGTLIDGTEFDSSYSRGEPTTFHVNGVIPGWREALQLMKEGAKWQVFVPSSLAYGERGAGGKIGPNAVLIFDIELISVK
jgi:FKBP-type peptidyl-prolyl cis-trans isomerase FklB